MNKWKYILIGGVLANIPLVLTFLFAANFLSPLLPLWAEGIMFIIAVISLFIVISLILLGLLFKSQKITCIQFGLLYTLPRKISHCLLLVIHAIMLAFTFYYMNTLEFFASPFQYGFLLLLFTVVIYFYFMFNGLLILLLNKKAI